MLVSIVLIALTSVVAQGAVMIDSFDGAQSLAVKASGPVSQTSMIPAAGALGGLRGAQLDFVSGPLGSTLDIDPGGSGILAASTDAITSASAATWWDGWAGAFSLGADLTDAGWFDNFVLGVLFDDLPTVITLEVYTDPGNWATADLALPGGIYTPQEFLLPFASFGGGAGGVDFSNVGMISMKFELDPSTDLALDFIKTDVPEPATLSLVALSWLALLKRRRA